MCGIIGYFSEASFEPELRAGIRSLIHRGPDHQDVKTDSCGEKMVGLGHTRLSIIDLDPRSHQPFLSKDQRQWLTYNGEVYNFREIQKDLVALGVEFRTTSDTEVFLEAYRAWGTDAFARFRGIFAAAIVDLENHSVTLVRDPMGVKPLYYWHNDLSGLFFASEIKALLCFPDVPVDVDLDDMFSFLCEAFVPEPGTGFKDVRKVPPGHYIRFSEDMRQEVGCFFDFAPGAAQTELSALWPELERSCNEQQVADVEVSLLFSGGTDSTVLAYMNHGNLRGVFAQYDSQEIRQAGFVDDSEYVDAISRHLGMEVETCHMGKTSTSPDTLLDEAKRAVTLTEELMSDYTTLVSETICQKAREMGHKVVLSGMGGDEAFAGYPRHFLARHHSSFRALKWPLKRLRPLLIKLPSLAKKIDRLVNFLEAPNFALGYSSLVGYFSREEVKTLLPVESLASNNDAQTRRRLEGVESESTLKQAMILDRTGFLAHNLIVADKSSMAASVEMRVPLLDPIIYKQALDLPDSALIQGLTLKAPLKHLLRKALPRRLVRRPKSGFNPPMDEKVNALGESRVLDEFQTGPIFDFLSKPVVTGIVRDHFSRRRNNTFKIWQLLYLNAWLDFFGFQKPVNNLAASSNQSIT